MFLHCFVFLIEIYSSFNMPSCILKIKIDLEMPVFLCIKLRIDCNPFPFLYTIILFVTTILAT